MNKLDDKVIIDREVFVGILDMARRGLDSGFFGEVFHQDFAKGEQALAANLTGWAAVPVKLKESMYDAIQRTGDQQSECRKVKEYFKKGNYIYGWFLVREAPHTAMLEASPLLPGGE